MITNAAKKVVVIIGAGPGTGLAIAKRFAQAGNPVALVARQRSRLESLAEDINSLRLGPARVFDADAIQKQSVDDTFGEIRRSFGPSGAKVWGAVYNPGGFLQSPVLEVTEQRLRAIVDVQFFGGFFFTQAYLQALLADEGAADASGDADSAESRGFVAFAGASASLKGSANFSAFSAAKGALRNLAQSTAREWQPKGVHVFHTIVDGFIDTEATREILGTNFAPNTRVNPTDVAEAYYNTAVQRRSAWTHESDLRPFSETF